MLRKHLRRKLQTFEEKTKQAISYGERPSLEGKRTSLKLYQFYSTKKNTRKERIRLENHFTQRETEQTHLYQPETFPKTKKGGKNFRNLNFFDEDLR